MLARSPRGRRSPSFALVVACAMLPACAAAAAPTAAHGEKALHAWEGGDSPAALEAWVQDRLRRADADVARVLGAKGARSVANTLRPYDDAVNELLLAVSQSSVIYGVGATRELRDKAQSLTQTANAAYTALNLNQGVYRALAALPSPADSATRHYLEHSLLEYRLAGVDRDEATRAKIKALQDKITALGLTFERAVHDDVRTTVADKAQLEGLPPDYLASHPADPEGHVKITTDPPDGWPAQRFSNSAELRHTLFLAANSVGYPANTETLRALLATRAELAQLLGYKTWADFAMADQMIGSPAKLARARMRRCCLSRASATRRSSRSHTRTCATGRSSTGAPDSTSTRRACGRISPTPGSSAG